MTQVLKSLETDSQPTRQVFQLSEEEIKQIVQVDYKFKKIKLIIKKSIIKNTESLTYILRKHFMNTISLKKWVFLEIR